MHVGLIFGIVIVGLGDIHISHRSDIVSDLRSSSVLTEITLSSLASLRGSIHLGHDVLEVLNNEAVLAGSVPHLNLRAVLHDVAVATLDLTLLVRLLVHSL